MLHRFHEKIILFDEVDSTNNYLKQTYKNHDNYTIVKANYQTAGRGQFDRVWQANKGENLLCSILFKDDLSFLPEEINPILVTAIRSTLQDLGIVARFKSPNDLYVGDEKIAGILIETKYDNHSLGYMIVGIGLNVNQTTFSNVNATSIKCIIGKHSSTHEVLEMILRYIEHNIELLKLIKDDNNEH